MLPQGYEWQGETARTSAAKGKAEGKAEGVLEILDARGIVANEAQRRRVLSFTDLDQLRQWIRRAATITTADELFTE